MEGDGRESMGRGRRTSGPELVEGLEGSQGAKRRLKVILETLSGKKKIADACEELGICEAAFHKFRSRTLQDALESLEPRPVGRKPVEDKEQGDAVELLREIESLRMELKASHVREEIALVMPYLGLRGEEKKRRKGEGARGEAGRGGAPSEGGGGHGGESG